MTQSTGSIHTSMVISEFEINERLKALAPEIKDYFDSSPNRRLMTGLMKGGMSPLVWMANHLGRIGPCAEMTYIDTSRYGDAEEEVLFSWNHSPLTRKDVEGASMLICDDVADKNRTLFDTIERLSKWNPAEIKTFVLTSKPDAHEVDVTLDYVGFEVAKDLWLGGAGMDINQTPEGQWTRMLPYVCCKGDLPPGLNYWIPGQKPK